MSSWEGAAGADREGNGSAGGGGTTRVGGSGRAGGGGILTVGASVGDFGAPAADRASTALENRSCLT
ncbi:MAG TPA: hypothetical protein VF579_00720, partial [Candidatus Methylomirabilis sp.]